MRRLVAMLSVLSCCWQASALAVESEWSDQEIAKLKRLSIPIATFGTAALLPPPPSPGNRVADSPQAAEFGKSLFFDARLSGNGELACASCHLPERGYSDNMSTAKGENLTTRNTPTLIGTANDKWWFWDGRSDSLWSQALLPFEAPDEMAGSRIAILQTVATDPVYRNQYTTLFGNLPANEFIQQLDSRANPAGNLDSRTRWFQISDEDRQIVNSAFANLGKSIAAFERTLLHSATRFDRFAHAIIQHAKKRPHNGTAPITINSTLFTQQEINGLKLYLDDSKTHCRNCHNGARFSNSEFYDVGTGKLTGRNADLGRAMGLAAVRQSAFNCMGPYSDVNSRLHHSLCRLPQIHTPNNSVFMLGAFKTPSLRELTKTAPYFHDGRAETLQDVIAHYRALDNIFAKRKASIATDVADAKDEHRLPPLDLIDKEASALIAFLETLSSP